jgi:AcrR family transcriptional regulator
LLVVPAAKARRRQSTYHSPLRERQAAETRKNVLDAATQLFIERGWAGTTVAAVAADAGTAIETVYSAFGSKSGLLTAAIDVAIVGDDLQEPLAERLEFTALGEGGLSDRMAAAAQLIAHTHVRSVPLLRALQEAAASDKPSASRWSKYESDRRTVIEIGLKMIIDRNAPAHLIDSIWALASPEVFTKLTKERAWTIDRYEAWLLEIASALLLTSD